VNAAFSSVQACLAQALQKLLQFILAAATRSARMDLSAYSHGAIGFLAIVSLSWVCLAGAAIASPDATDRDAAPQCPRCGQRLGFRAGRRAHRLRIRRSDAQARAQPVRAVYPRLLELREGEASTR
jgi:hypothetical protein